jgi:hypothetical protein
LKGLSRSNSSSGGTSRSGSPLPTSHGVASTAVRQAASSGSVSVSAASHRQLHLGWSYYLADVHQRGAYRQPARLRPVELLARCCAHLARSWPTSPSRGAHQVSDTPETR